MFTNNLSLNQQHVADAALFTLTCMVGVNKIFKAKLIKTEAVKKSCPISLKVMMHAQWDYHKGNIPEGNHR